MKAGAWILVVDDDQKISEMLRRALGWRGFRVDATNAPEEAIRLAGENAHDAALVDLAMPGLDGASLTEALRRLRPGLPIGLITGYTHSPLVGAAERSGTRLFKKPVEIQSVVDFLTEEIR
jgi:DNA-binding NtrC family response regulator